MVEQGLPPSGAHQLKPSDPLPEIARERQSHRLSRPSISLEMSRLARKADDHTSSEIFWGLQPNTSKTEPVWSQAPPECSSPDATRFEKFKTLLRQYPNYWIVEFLLAMCSLVVCALPTLLASLAAHLQVEERRDDFNGTLAELEQEPGFTPKTVTLACLAATTVPLAVMAITYTINRTYWSGSFVTPIARRFLLPMFALHCTLRVAERVLSATGTIVSSTATLGASLLIVFVGVGTFCFKVSRAVHCHCFFPILLTSIALWLLYVFLYEVRIMPSVLSSSDLFKAVFVVAVNPLLWEPVLIFVRVGIRASVANVHSSTLYILCLTPMILNKLFSRMVAVTIQDTALLNLALLGLLAKDVLLCTTLKQRDRTFYKVFCCCVPSANRLDAMKDKRNNAFIVQIVRSEFQLEYIFIVLNAIQLYVYDISPKTGVSAYKQYSPDVHVMEHSLLEILYIMCTDFIIISVLTLFQDEPFIFHAHMKHRFQWVCMGVLCSFGSSFMAVNVLPDLVERTVSHNSHPATWTYISE